MSNAGRVHLLRSVNVLFRVHRNVLLDSPILKKILIILSGGVEVPKAIKFILKY